MNKKNTSILRRLWRHICFFPWQAKRICPTDLLTDLANNIHLGEQRHLAQIRLVIEGDWHLGEIWAGITPQKKARQIFGELGIWDTESNNGILVYLCIAEHYLEIITDRGLAHIPNSVWEQLCQDATKKFGRKQYREGLTDLITQINHVLTDKMPRGTSNQDTSDTPVRNELPDHPVLR